MYTVIGIFYYPNITIQTITNNERNYIPVLNVSHFSSEKVFKRWVVPFKIFMSEYSFEFLGQEQPRMFQECPWMVLSKRDSGTGVFPEKSTI